MVAILKEKFEKRVGKTTPASLNPEILEKMRQLEVWMTSEEFLLKKTPRIPTGVKIRQGVEVVYEHLEPPGMESKDIAKTIRGPIKPSKTE